MDKNKVLNLLGLANRAGFVVSGEDNVILGMKKNKIKLVFIACDSSDNTIDKFERKCFFYKVEMKKDFSFDELSSSLGKPRKIIGITDAGFVKAMKEEFGR